MLSPEECEVLREHALRHLEMAWGRRPATPRQRWFIQKHRLEVRGELTKFSAYRAISDYCRAHPSPR